MMPAQYSSGSGPTFLGLRHTTEEKHILRHPVVKQRISASMAVSSNLDVIKDFKNHFKVASHSYPVGLTERLFILCRTAGSLLFDLSSLTTSLLAGECSSSCGLSLPSFLARFPTEENLTALISAFNIQVESSSQHIRRCNIVWAHATTSNVL